MLAHPADMLAKQIGANIRAARESRTPKLSLQKLAAKIDPPTSYQQLSRLEEAERPLTLDWIERIAKAMDMDPMELLAPDLFRATIQAAPTPLHLDEQVATQAARTLAAAALGAEPSTDTVQLVAGLLRDLVGLFSGHPEAASDPRLASPAINLLDNRFARAAS